MAEDWDLAGLPASERAWWALRKALGDLDPHEQRIGSEDPTPPPRWPSTLPYVEANLGGFYGVTTLAGRGGVGKSMLGFASAIEAAACGEWNVVYLTAEMATDELARRADKYLAAHPDAADAVERLTMIHLPRNPRLEAMADMISAASACGASDAPTLVCLDSVNTCAQMMRAPYLVALRDLALWAMLSRRISRGTVSWLLVSELNKTGGVKGEQLTYWSDVVLTLKNPSGKQRPNVVEMELTKSRSTGGEGPMGLHIRAYEQFRFVPERDVKLRVVGGSDRMEW